MKASARVYIDARGEPILTMLEAIIVHRRDSHTLTKLVRFVLGSIKYWSFKKDFQHNGFLAGMGRINLNKRVVNIRVETSCLILCYHCYHVAVARIHERRA